MHANTLTLLAIAATGAAGHGYVSKWNIGSKEFKGFDEMWQTDPSKLDKFIAWSTTASDNGFVDPSAYGSPDIICHKNGKNGQLNTATVQAGDSITATWNTWPDSHKGPVIDYIAAADDPITAQKTSLKWLKIQEDGYDSSTKTWATDKLIKNSFSHVIKIPSSLKPGNYVLRHEIIALHSASNQNGAQNYPQCVNLKVTGSGSELPTGSLGTALYKADEQGIVTNIYSGFTSYTIPGPKLAFAGVQGKRNHARNVKCQTAMGA